MMVLTSQTTLFSTQFFLVFLALKTVFKKQLIKATKNIITLKSQGSRAQLKQPLIANMVTSNESTTPKISIRAFVHI